MKDKIHKFDDIVAKLGEISVWWRYTQGVVGQRFFRELKLNKKLFGIKCPKCGRVFLPPRMYCDDCFEYTKEWMEINPRGYIDYYTVVYYDLDDNLLEEPQIVAFIRFDGVEGGLIHFVKGVDVEEEIDLFGLEVEPVFREERKGSITDIEYFKPVER